MKQLFYWINNLLGTLNTPSGKQAVRQNQYKFRPFQKHHKTHHTNAQSSMAKGGVAKGNRARAKQAAKTQGLMLTYHRHQQKLRSQLRSQNNPPNNSHAPEQTFVGQPIEQNTVDPHQVVYTVDRQEAVQSLNRALTQNPSSKPSSSENITMGWAQGITTRHKSPTPDHKTQNNRTQAKRMPQQYSSKPANADSQPLVSFADIAYLSQMKGDYAEAEQLYQQGLIYQKQQAIVDYPKVATIQRSLARLYCLQDRYSEAEQRLQQALTLQRQSLPAKHIETGETLYTLAQLHQHHKRYSQADACFQEALIIFRQQLGAKHPRTKAVYSDLMAMMATLIEQDQFTKLTANLPPLDLNTLGDTYSWAKPRWQRTS
ncbi:MAG: tetratricopeptide repeat protein [Cyanobacteria bacterium P01_F01_bin.53]